MDFMLPLKALEEMAEHDPIEYTTYLMQSQEFKDIYYLSDMQFKALLILKDAGTQIISRRNAQRKLCNRLNLKGMETADIIRALSNRGLIYSSRSKIELLF